MPGKEKQRDMSCDRGWHREAPSDDVFIASVTNKYLLFLSVTSDGGCKKKKFIIKGILIIPSVVLWKMETHLHFIRLLNKKPLCLIVLLTTALPCGRRNSS